MLVLLDEGEVDFWTTISTTAGITDYALARFNAAKPWELICPIKDPGLMDAHLQKTRLQKEAPSIDDIISTTAVSVASLQRPIDIITPNQGVINFNGGVNVFVNVRNMSDTQEQVAKATLY